MDFEIRGDRRPQGPLKLLKERELYLSLVDQGMGNAQACRIVGVHERLAQTSIPHYETCVEVAKADLAALLEEPRGADLER
ncbi:hypothetical protein RKD18_000292 [Streptomyces phaeoluteigriseus]